MPVHTPTHWNFTKISLHATNKTTKSSSTPPHAAFELLSNSHVVKMENFLFQRWGQSAAFNNIVGRFVIFFFSSAATTRQPCFYIAHANFVANGAVCVLLQQFISIYLPTHIYASVFVIYMYLFLFYFILIQTWNSQTGIRYWFFPHSCAHQQLLATLLA